MDKYTKKEKLQIERQIKKMEIYFGRLAENLKTFCRRLFLSLIPNMRKYLQRERSQTDGIFRSLPCSTAIATRPASIIPFPATTIPNPAFHISWASSPKLTKKEFSWPSKNRRKAKKQSNKVKCETLLFATPYRCAGGEVEQIFSRKLCKPSG